MSTPLRQRFESPWFAAGVLALLTGLVYWPAAGFDFLNWDDPWYVVDNLLIQNWSPSNLAAIATEPCSKNYAPLTIFTLLVEHTFFGLWAGGYHLVNVALHAANAVLVLLLVRQVTQSRWISWFTAILFAVHPIQVETVAWVSSLKSLLAGLGMLASLLYWLKRERTGRDEGLGLMWLAVALLAKASAVVVPAIVLLWDVLVLQKKFRDALVRQILPGLLCLLALFQNMHAQNQIWGGSREHFNWGLPKILAVDSVIVWRYVAVLFAPHDLSVMYDVDASHVWPLAAIALAAWLVVSAVVWRIRKQYPLVAWSYATWFILLFPVLNIFPITTLMNDRYLYLPCVLAFALAAAGIQSMAAMTAWNESSRAAIAAGGLSARRAISMRWIVGSAVAVMMALATGLYTAQSQRYLEVWRNPVTLWRHAIRQSPHLPVVQIQWALTLRDFGHLPEARAILNDVLAQSRTDEGDRKRVEAILEEWATQS